MKRTWAVHPLLFALYPVLFVYSQNLGQVTLSQVWSPLLLIGAFTLLLVALLALILRSVAKAGLIVSLFLLLFFGYSQICKLILGSGNSAAYGPWIVLAAMGLVFAGAMAFFVRLKERVREVTQIFNVVALVLVVMPLLNIGTYEFKRMNSQQAEASTPSLQLEQTKPVQAGELPDIYYIILDGYARADVLERIYNYDNSEFLDFLGEKGFFIASESRANYCQTPLSLASSLNLDYLDELAAHVGPDTTDREPLTKAIRDSHVLRFLKEQGYQIVSFPTGYYATDLKDIDVRMGSEQPLSELQIGLLVNTPIPWLVAQQSAFNPYAPYRDRTLYTLNHLADTARLPSPHFVLAHVLSPHPPFVLDENGNEIEPRTDFNMGDGNHFIERGGTQAQYVEGYRDQLTFINKKVEAALDELLSQSSRPAIVIVQADHGPGSHLDWNSLENSDLEERLAILNAYLLPDGGSADLYAGITPVNTFRLIFNRYFGTDLDLLPDKSYFSLWERPYQFIDVTARLQADAAASHSK